MNVSGWSGYNVVNISGLTTYGNTVDSQYGHIQFIFGCDVGTTDSRYVGMAIYKIFGFGGVGWTIPSTMAKTGHLYSYDASQNASFPASVYSYGFCKNNSNNDYVLLGGGSHKAVSDFAASSHDHSSISGSAYTLSSFAESSGSQDRYVWHSWSDNTAKVAYNSGIMFNPDAATLKVKHFEATHVSGGSNEFRIKYSSTVDFAMMIGTGNENHGLYDSIASKWMIYSDASGNVTLNGNAATATYATSAGSANSASSATNATNARYVIGDNNAKDPGYALLQSGSGRTDASPAGDTWIFYDNLGGTSTPWGIKHEQGANYISFYGAGNRRNYIDLSTGNFYAAGTIYEGGTALNTRYAALSHTHSYAGSSSAGGAATNAVVTDSNSNSTYKIVWHSGNSLYSTSDIYCNPSTDALIAKSMRASANDMYVGNASGSQCHQQYDTTNECLKFLFD